MMLFLLLGGAAAVFVLLLAVGAGAYFLFVRTTDTASANAGGNQDARPGNQNKGGKDDRLINPAPGKGGGTPQQPKDGIAVKFWVPKKVGDVREITFTNDMFDKTNDNVAGNQNGQTNTRAQVFKGKIKTLQVDNEGKETLAEVTVDQCTDTFNGKTVALLGAGTVMVLEATPGWINVSFKNGGPYNDNIGAAFLRKAVNMPLPKQAADDVVRIFSTTERKKVGDTWTGDKEVLLELVNKTRTDKLPASAVSGKARVAGLVKEAGVTYVDLEAEIVSTFKDFTETIFNKQPANLKVNGEIKTVFTYRFPIDFSTGPVKSGWKNVLTTRHEGTLNNQNATMVTEIRDSWSETAKYTSAVGKAPPDKKVNKDPRTVEPPDAKAPGNDKLPAKDPSDNPRPKEGKVPTKDPVDNQKPKDPPVKDPGDVNDGIVVKFWVPKKVGDVRELTFTNDMFDKTNDQIGAKKLTSQTNTTAQVLKGKIKTLQVDAEGKETQVEVTVDQCTNTFNGNKAPLLGPGTVMVLEAKTGLIEVRYKNGGPYNDKHGVPFLRKAVNMPLPGQPADDVVRIFSTPERKKVGDTWTGDQDLLVSLINKHRNDKLPASAIAGKARLVALPKDGGITYADLEVTITTTFKNFTETLFNNQPANLKVNGDIKTTFVYRFPADFSTGSVRSGWKNMLLTRHEGLLNGQDATLLTEIRDSWNETTKYLAAL
jgi:hypothetical protein